jgi:glycosyltransferase involved in cell wall biosynthesis
LKRKIVVSVISDLVSDQRVHKVCTFLNTHGFDVALIGRKNNQSLPLEERSYKCERIQCWFNKGIPLYAEFMLKLFAKLLTKRAEIFLSNDLDTLLPNFLVSNFRNKKLVYDSHEYFTGVPELENSLTKKKIWRSLEKLILPRLKHAYTVNQSIASLYQSEYGIKMKVVRNVPVLQPETEITRQFYPADKTILLLQGAGINEERGAEELVQSMTLLPENFKLYLIGSGTCWNKLKSLTSELGLHQKVELIEKLPFRELRNYTSQAHLGLSLDKPISTNYKLSLPNKIFDYIHAGIPVLSSSVVEVEKIINDFEVGTTITEVTPNAIAKAIMEIFTNPGLYNQWRNNTRKAAEELCWQKEEKVLEEIFSAV